MTQSKGWRHPPAVMARKRKPAWDKGQHSLLAKWNKKIRKRFQTPQISQLNRNSGRNVDTTTNKNSSSCPFSQETKARPPSSPLFHDADLISEPQYRNMRFSCESPWRLVATNASHRPPYQWKKDQRIMVRFRTHFQKKRREAKV